MYIWLVQPSDWIARPQVNALWNEDGFQVLDFEKTEWNPFTIQSLRSDKEVITVSPDNTRVVHVASDSVESLCRFGYKFHQYLEDIGSHPGLVVQKVNRGVPWARSWVLQDLVRFPSSDFMHLWGTNAPFIDSDKMCQSWRGCLTIKDGDCYIGRIAAPPILVPGGRYLIGEYGCMFEDSRGYIQYFNALAATPDRIRTMLLRKSRFPKSRLGSRL